MKFPSLEFVHAIQEQMNGDAAFHTASRWSDVKVLLCFGDQRYWLKLYGGKIIDVMNYFPMANPLGWDYMISAPLEIWRALRDGRRALGHLLDTGDIMIDGDLLQANRLVDASYAFHRSRHEGGILRGHTPMAHEITGRYTIVDGARTYYDVCGSGVPLVCIHMGWACSLQWHHFMPIMAAAGFKVIAPDLPGHAKSMPVNWKPFRRMRGYTEWVWHFIEKVCPGEKPVVCGSGIGGDMTLQIACHHPRGIRAGMAFESAARTGSISFLSGYSDPHTFPGFSALTDNASTSAMYYPCDPRKVIESKWQHRSTYQETCVADMDAWNDHDVREHLHNIECPIFLFKGEADYHVTEQAVMDTIAAIPNGLAEGGIAKKVGHLIMMEQPELLAEACLGFLRRRKII